MEETKVDVNNCIFKGNIADDSFHIDGESISEKKEPMNLHIKSCEFLSGKETAVSLENKVKFDEKAGKIKKHSKCGIRAVSVIFADFTCIAVLSAFFVHFIMKKNQQTSNEDCVEL